MFHVLHKVDMCTCYAKQKISLACAYKDTLKAFEDFKNKQQKCMK